MIVSSLEAVNFRNIKKLSTGFSRTYNFVTGRNAQGKTNLLEAIHLFSIGRSFRTRRSEEMIMFGKEFFFLRLAGRSDSGVDFALELGMERGGRTKASVNGKALSGVADMIGFLPTVLFEPADVGLTSGPPAGRRMFLDYTAAQISPAFLANLKEYRRVLRHRNALLRGINAGTADASQLGPWDGMLAEKGSGVANGREEILEGISGTASAIYGEICPGDGPLVLEYRCSFDQEGSTREESLAAALGSSRAAEIRRGYTMAGPHCDDVVARVGDQDLRRFGSQGRKRLSAIVLKLAQAEAIMDRRGERPVVLLDDIFSELDAEVSAKVRGMLTDRYQSVITSPREPDAGSWDPSAARFTVEDGVFQGPMCGENRA